MTASFFHQMFVTVPTTTKRRVLDAWAVNCAMLRRRLRLRTPAEKAEAEAMIQKGIDDARQRFDLVIDGDAMEPEYIDADRVHFHIVDLAAVKPSADYHFHLVDGRVMFRTVMKVGKRVITVACRNQDRYPGTETIAVDDVEQVAYAVGTWKPAPSPCSIEMMPA
jgi:hypothetical protein